MADFLGKCPIIHDGNWKQYVNPTVNGEVKKCGTIPRCRVTMPVGNSPYAVPFESLNIPIIPRSEWDARFEEQEAQESSLIHIRRRSGPDGKHIPSLDQDGVGYCWNHSGTMAVMLLRAAMNLPYVRLSAFMVGCLIKNYQDEGGWGAHGLQFICKNGVPSVDFWKEKSMSRSNDTPEMRANALLHRVTESFVDLDAAVYDANMTEEQVATLLFCNIPVIGDSNWWGHSTVWAKWHRIERGSWGPKGINSWTDGWGDLGEFVLQGSKRIPDGASAPAVTNASVV